MKIITGIIYDDKPKDVVVYPSSVYVLTSCEEIEDKQEIDKVDDEGNVIEGETEVVIFVKYRCDVEIYSLPEYINKLQLENASLNNQIIELQLALTEVYEMII